MKKWDNVAKLQGSHVFLRTSKLIIWLRLILLRTIVLYISIPICLLAISTWWSTGISYSTLQPLIYHLASHISFSFSKSWHCHAWHHLNKIPAIYLPPHSSSTYSPRSVRVPPQCHLDLSSPFQLHWHDFGSGF